MDINSTDSMIMFRPSRDVLQTIMVVDLCGSTELASENEVMAVHLNRRLEQIAASVLETYRSTSFKGTGDGFLSTLPDTSSAVRASLELLDTLADRNRTTVNPPIHIRIALHHGRTYQVFDTGTKEVYGHDVNVAFRIERLQPALFTNLENDFPERDRILCSRQFRDTYQQSPSAASGLVFARLGEVRLKGIEEPVEVFWLRKE
ncbi:MAG: adenylate/guanylate cyclase domain-containing protein [Kiritimatiellae bacterium]|nr:adenylate/guanylate cyclase domain-containing protein [Kiritimatiellia bacterium]